MTFDEVVKDRRRIRGYKPFPVPKRLSGKPLIFSGYWLFRRCFAAEELFGDSKQAIALILAADAVA